MRDKLFWFALIFAGFYLFSRMNTQSTGQTQIPTETTQETTQERNQQSDRSSLDEPHFGDQDAPLRLPQKEGQSSQQPQQRTENYAEPTRTEIPDIQKQDKDADISLGEYGSISLPKKNGTTSNNNNTTTPESATESKTVNLNPNTKRGEGILRDINNQALVVLEGKILQVSSFNNSELYLDQNSLCTINSGSNNVIYVMNAGELMLTGNGSNNTIYYAEGSSVRNGINGSNNQFIPLRDINFR